MKPGFSFLLLSLLFVLIPLNVQAFSVDLVDISIDESGDAVVQMNYNTNHVEVGAYSLANVVMDIKTVAKERLEKVFQKTVSVEVIEPEVSRFRVYDFASVKNETYISPSFQFLQAENLFDNNLKWVKDALSLNFSPKITKVRFIDGYAETFKDTDTIPSVTHTLQ